MIGFFKKLFGSKPVEAEAPYKVETSAEAPAIVATPVVEDTPVVETPTKKAPAKKAVAKKPRKPKAPK